jgi:flagellar biosynthesis/type III secretory pathway chaperone
VPVPDVGLNTEATALTALLGELSTVLDEELAALGARDVERLEAAIERKSALVAELEAATGKFCRPGQPLPAQWTAVRTLAIACAEANRKSGGAIALNRGLVAQLIDITQGGRLGTATYTAHGRMRRRDASRGVGYA